MASTLFASGNGTGESCTWPKCGKGSGALRGDQFQGRSLRRWFGAVAAWLFSQYPGRRYGESEHEQSEHDDGPCGPGVCLWRCRAHDSHPDWPLNAVDATAHAGYRQWAVEWL